MSEVTDSPKHLLARVPIAVGATQHKCHQRWGLVQGLPLTSQEAWEAPGSCALAVCLSAARASGRGQEGQWSGWSDENEQHVPSTGGRSPRAGDVTPSARIPKCHSLSSWNVRGILHPPLTE